MPNTSATGGYLQPTNTGPIDGDALFDFIQAWIVGITGMIGSLVRPRWQPEPPNIPKDGTDWAAFGITSRENPLFQAEIHVDDGVNSYDQIRTHEVLNISISFYGPNADSNCSIFREGMGLAQNREVLTLNNMGLVGWGNAVAVPELIKEIWLYRVDLDFSIRRQIVRNYSVLSLGSASGTVDNEHYKTNITA